MLDNLAFRTALPDRIETDRLVLRVPGQNDAPAIAALANNRKIHEMLSRLPHPYGLADAHAFISTIARSDTEHAYAIVDRQVGLVGIVSLIFAPGHAPELGYWLGEPYWGNGYGTEAARAVIDAATAIAPCQLTARVRSENLGSRRILEKLGFALAGEAIATCGPHKDIPVATYIRPGAL